MLRSNYYQIEPYTSRLRIRPNPGDDIFVKAHIGEKSMKTLLQCTKKLSSLIVITGLFLALILFLGYAVGEAQSGLYDAVVTCDGIGYSVTLSPDWGRPNFTYDFSNLPNSFLRRRTTINMAPSTDPMSDTWANIGGSIAYVNFAAHWVQQSRQLLPPPAGPYVTDVDVYTNFNLVIDQANCLAAPSSPSSCDKRPRYFMYTFRDNNQPETWQEYCYIISHNGYPGVESQARICSVPNFDHVYRASKLVYKGWVSTDCNGIASYGFPEWQSSWYRPRFEK